MMSQKPRGFGVPGLEPVALRIARINEDLGELQDMLEVAMREMDSQQAEAALELQRLRARLLDGLCPAKLRQSERVKRLAKRLARLEQNVGREQTECVKVMEAVLATVERNGAVAEAVCQHLGTRRVLAHGYHDMREPGGIPSACQQVPRALYEAVDDGTALGVTQVIDDRQGDAGAIIEEAMQAMQKMMASLERHEGEESAAGFQDQRAVLREASCHASTGGTLAKPMAETQQVVQPSAEAQPSAEHVAVGESEEPEEKAQGVQSHEHSETASASALHRGSEEAPPTPNRSDLGRPAPVVEVRRLSSQEASEEGSSSGTSPENLVKRVSSDDGSSSSGSSEVIERD